MRALRHSIIALTPFETPDVRLCLHAVRAEVLGVLDLGRDVSVGLAALRALSAEIGRGYGVRLAEPRAFEPNAIAAHRPDCVVLPDPAHVAQWRAALPKDVAVIAQIVSMEEAALAVTRALTR